MHRTSTLAETWRRFSKQRGAAGITRLAELTGLDTLGIPVWAAIRPMGKSLSTQQGKGTSSDAARVSALMEALETFSAENITLPITRGAYRSLAKRRNVVDIRQLPRAARRAPLSTIIPWVEGRVQATGAPILVPFETVTLDTTAAARRAPLFDVSSNGLASGNTLDEAIQHGLCEVVERHAEAAWRRAGDDRRIVVDTIAAIDPSGEVLALVERVVASGARIFLWDLTCEIPITVIGAAIVEDPREPAWRPLGVYQGFGASLAPELAIARAITEAAQTRLTYIAGARDDFFPVDYERATDPELVAGVWERFTQPADEPVDARDLPAYDPPDLATALALVGREVIVVDLTHPKLRVPVVKVIVPGLAKDVELLG